MLKMIGKIAGKKTSTNDGKTTTTVKFLIKNDEDISAVGVKLKDNRELKMGDDLSLNVAVSTFNGNIYFKEI